MNIYNKILGYYKYFFRIYEILFNLHPYVTYLSSKFNVVILKEIQKMWTKL